MGPSTLARRWLLLGAATLAGLVILVVVLNVIPTIHDPTEQTYTVQLLNDRQEPVEVAYCLTPTCSKSTDDNRLAPQRSALENVSAGTTEHFVVRQVGDGVIGCASIFRAVPARNAILRLSQLGRCG